MNWATCTTFTNAYIILVVKSHVRRPLERATCRREENIKVHFREVGFKSVNCIKVIEDRVSGFLVV